MVNYGPFVQIFRFAMKGPFPLIFTQLPNKYAHSKVDVLHTAPLITGSLERSMAITGVESVLPAQKYIILKCFVILKQVEKKQKL